MIQNAFEPEVGFTTPLTDAGLSRNWTTIWDCFSRRPPPGLRALLERAYSEEQRFYHNQGHLRECLALWDRWKNHAEHPGEVGLALWFHDSVYDPVSQDNEMRSAAWAMRELTESGLSPDTVQRIYDLVLCTAHETPAESATNKQGESSATANPTNEGRKEKRVKDIGTNGVNGAARRIAKDKALLLDIDLAILGAPPERFAQYEADIAREYAWVPRQRYREKRAEVLTGFLEREPLYRTRAAKAKLEAQARQNLLNVIRQLRA